MEIRYEKEIDFKIVITIILALSMLMFLYYVLKVNLIQYFVLILLCITLLLRTEDCLKIYFLLLPNTRMFMLNGNSLISIFLLLLAMKYFILENKEINLFQLLLSAVLIINTALTFFKIVDFQFLIATVKFLIYTLFFVSILNKNGVFIKKAVQCYIIGCIFTVFFALLHYYIFGYGALGSRIIGVNNDPNYYAINIAVGASFSIVLGYNDRKNEVIYIFMAIMLSIFGLFSGSRTFALISIFNIIALIPLFLRKSNYSKKLLMILIIIAIFFIFYDKISVYINNIILRFQEDNVVSGNGRIDLWIEYIKFLYQDLQMLFLGAGEPVNYIVRNGGIFEVVPHSWYVDLLFSYGIIGALIYITAIVHAISLVYNRNFKFKIIVLLPLLILLLGSATVSSINSDFQIAIILLVFTLNRLFKKEGEIYDNCTN